MVQLRQGEKPRKEVKATQGHHRMRLKAMLWCIYRVSHVTCYKIITNESDKLSKHVGTTTSGTFRLLEEETGTTFDVVAISY